MSQARARLAATGEAVAVFVVAVVMFRSLLALTLNRWETQLVPGSALRFVEYGTVIVLVLGWGAILSAGLFGIWHVILGSGGAAAWWHGLWTFFAGLIFSYLREKSGSIVAPSLLHSVMNYLPLG